MVAEHSVWVKLYIGQDDRNPRVSAIDHFSGNIYHLKKKIKEEEQNGLAHADASQLSVYPAGTVFPSGGGFVSVEVVPANALVRELVPLPSFQLPLVVVALPAQQLQQKLGDDDDDNILGQGVYEKLTSSVCFFADEGDKPIGAGFAISETTAYSVAHNFPEAAVDMEILCHFGKPHQRLVRKLRISVLDLRLDFCILRTVPGETTLPNFLEVSTAPLQPGKNCILAAFQIGIQDELKYLDPDLSVGVFKGEISKLYPRHFVYQCPSFAGNSGGAVVLKNGRVIGIHQETVIQARERIQHGADLVADARLGSVEASIDDLLRSLSSGSISLQLSAITEPKKCLCM